MPQNYEFFSIRMVVVAYWCEMLPVVTFLWLGIARASSFSALALRNVAYCCLVRPPASRLFGMPFPAQARNFAVPPLSAFCRCRGTHPLPVPYGNGWRVATKNRNLLFLLLFRKKRKLPAVPTLSRSSAGNSGGR